MLLTQLKSFHETLVLILKQWHSPNDAVFIKICDDYSGEVGGTHSSMPDTEYCYAFDDFDGMVKILVAGRVQIDTANKHWEIRTGRSLEDRINILKAAWKEECSDQRGLGDLLALAILMLKEQADADPGVDLNEVPKREP